VPETTINIEATTIHININITMTNREDSFFTGENMRHIVRNIAAFESGMPGVVKTFDDLEDMESA